MGKIAVIKMDKSKAGDLEVSDTLTDAPYHPFLVKDAVVYQQAKSRQGTHAVKTRSQVSGSRKKLYRQKGTGNARVGDRKATQRRGGGIVHGPVVRDHGFKLNKKVRKAAMRSALAEKIRTGGVTVLEAITPDSHKTKDFAAWLHGLEATGALIVTHEITENLARAARNLPDVLVIPYTRLSVYNLLRHTKVLMTRDALQAVEKRISGEKAAS